MSLQIDEDGGFTDMALGTAQQPVQMQNGMMAPTHGLIVRFFMHPLENKAQSLEEGRPVYEDTEYVRIMVPGDKSSVVERPVRIGNQPMSDNIRFNMEYNMFKAGNEDSVIGTPLREWPLMSKSRIKELEYFNVKTVEQLAGMPDTAAQNFSGLGALREQAKRYISEAKEGAVLIQMQTELETRDNIIATMQMQLDEMKAELALIQKVPVNNAATVEKPTRRK